MAGSRKGEKRGAARGDNGRPSTKPTGPKLPRLPNKQSEEYARQILTIVSTEHTQRNPLPKEFLHDVAQAYFFREVSSLMEHLRYLESSYGHPQLDLPGEADRLQSAIAATKIAIRDNLLLGAEMARTAAPYFHARVTPASQGFLGSSADQISMLIDEIDAASRGRPTWQKTELKLVSGKG